MKITLEPEATTAEMPVLKMRAPEEPPELAPKTPPDVNKRTDKALNKILKVLLILIALLTIVLLLRTIFASQAETYGTEDKVDETVLIKEPIAEVPASAQNEAPKVMEEERSITIPLPSDETVEKAKELVIDAGKKLGETFLELSRWGVEKAKDF